MNEKKQAIGEIINEYLHILWRRRWWVLVPAVIGPIISIVLIAYLPKEYRSTITILVEAQKVPEEYVKSTVSGNIEGRLSTIKQQLMSRSLLQGIIDRFGLYKKEYESMGAEDVIALMQKNIDVKTVGTRNVDAFSITFQGDDPKRVMDVTNELASHFIEENLKNREQLVEGTSEFLEQELKNVKDQLEAQENRIGEFKKIYMGELPQQLEANLRALDRFQADLVSTQLAIKSTADRKAMLEKSYEIAKQKMKQDAGESLQTSPNGSLSLSEKLADMEKKLTALQAEYKDSYPDIVMLKREISQVEEQIQLAGTHRVKEVREEGISGPERPESDVQALRGREADFPYLEDLRKQVRDMTLELQSLKQREAEAQKQLRIYSERVEKAPAREQELTILVRDYENTKKNYESILDKKLNAKISENLEKRQKGEQFRILDAANLPEKPVKPRRIIILIAGILAGIGGGIGLALLLEQFDSSVRKPEVLEQTISVPVLATIPDYKDEIRLLSSAREDSTPASSLKKPDKRNG